MNDDDVYKRVLLRCACRFCGDRWTIEARPDAWVVDCPDCDHMGRIGDIVIERDCDGDQDPSPELEAERHKLAELVEKVAIFCNPSTAARRIPWNWTSPSEVFRAVNIDQLIDELEEVQNLIDQASTQGRTVEGVPFGG